MSGFVNHEAAGVMLVAMPAPKIVGAVPGIQKPFEMDGEHLADRPAHKKLLDLAVVRSVTVVKGDGQFASGRGQRIENGSALLGVYGHRLLGYHIATRFQGANDVAMVGAIDRGDDHRIDALLGQHAFEFRRSVGGYRSGAQLIGVELIVVVHPGLIDVAIADQSAIFGTGGEQGLAVHI